MLKLLQVVRIATGVTVLCLGLAEADESSSAATVSVLPANSPLIDWAGRTVPDITGGNGKSFDWLGVQARLAVANASWLAVRATATGSQGRGSCFQRAIITYEGMPSTDRRPPYQDAHVVAV